MKWLGWVVFFFDVNLTCLLHLSERHLRWLWRIQHDVGRHILDFILGQNFREVVHTALCAPGDDLLKAFLTQLKSATFSHGAICSRFFSNEAQGFYLLHPYGERRDNLRIAQNRAA